jgi:hypothetical protein
MGSIARVCPVCKGEGYILEQRNTISGPLSNFNDSGNTTTINNIPTYKEVYCSTCGGRGVVYE